mgnify:CR=1 FL=1
MRIGILTLPLHTNYGGILQAYALQTVLKRMGHEVVVFDTPKKSFLPPLWKLPLCFGKRTLKRILGKNDRIFYEHYENKIRSVIAQNIQPFVDKNIHRKIIRNFHELSQEDYDAIVVGSDQVWRATYFVPLWLGQPMEDGFLAFTNGWNIKRISYAASFGTSIWEYTEEQTQQCKQLLQKFDAVSVREENGVKLCEKYFDVDALQVLDPTMLLVREDYIRLFKKSNTPKSKGNLLNYVLDNSDEIDHLIDEIAAQKHLMPFAVNNPFEYDDTKPLNMRIKLSVESWLRGFYDAEFVITDSFHACVFSILFKKQFVVVGNRERGMARFESLLQMFGLGNRLVSPDSEVCSLPMINYDVVYKKYDKLKEMSFAFLQNALKNKMK